MNHAFKSAMLAVLFCASSLAIEVHVAVAQSSQANSAAVTPATAAEPAIVASPAPTPAGLPITIPALTPVLVEIRSDLSSKTNKAGQTFPLRLATPITIDGRIIVPAGTTGEGEVLDAKHGGMAGSSGLLMLIAHDLKVDGRSLRLRSMQVRKMGADRSTQSAVAVALVGVFGMFVTGGETTIPAGTFAGAKTAEDFSVTLAPEPPAQPVAIATPVLSAPATTATP